MVNVVDPNKSPDLESFLNEFRLTFVKESIWLNLLVWSDLITFRTKECRVCYLFFTDVNSEKSCRTWLHLQAILQPWAPTGHTGICPKFRKSKWKPEEKCTRVKEQHKPEPKFAVVQARKLWENSIHGQVHRSPSLQQPHAQMKETVSLSHAPHIISSFTAAFLHGFVFTEVLFFWFSDTKESGKNEASKVLGMIKRCPFPTESAQPGAG